LVEACYPSLVMGQRRAHTPRPYAPRKLLTATLGLAVVSHLGTTACGGSTEDAGTGGTTQDGYGTGSYTSGNLVGPPGNGGTVSSSGGGPLDGSAGTGAWTSGNLVGPPGGSGGDIGCETGTAGEGGAPACDETTP